MKRVHSGLKVALILIVSAIMLLTFVVPAVAFDMDVGSGHESGSVPPNSQPPPQTGSQPDSGWKNPGSGDGSGVSVCGHDGEQLRMCEIRVTTMTGYTAHASCPSRSGAGANGGENIGYTSKTVQRRLRETGNLDLENEPNRGWREWQTMSSAVTSCYYAESWDDVSIHCVDNTVVTIDKVRPDSKNMGSKRKATAFAGNRTIANCGSSGQYVSISVELDEFGRYTALGQTEGRYCTARYYRSSNDLTGAMPADRIVSCGGLITLHASTKNMQIDCVNGVSEGFVEPAEFTAQACLDRDMAKTRCSVGDAPLFNDTARENEVEAFRDGEPNTIEWDPVSIEGSNVVDQTVTKTTLEQEGTPWNSKVGPTSDRQVAYVEHGDGKNALGSSINSNVREFEAGFYQASDGGKSNRFQLQPTYDLDVTLRTEKATITGYDPFGGLDYDTAPMNYSTTGDCTAEAINIDVLRSVNSGGGGMSYN